MKKFLLKGNLFEMATGVLMGAAVGKVVTSIVNDIIMPILGILIGGVDLTSLKYVITPETITSEGVKTLENAIYYGQFLQSVIDFLIIATFIYYSTKFMSKFIKREKEKEKIEDAPTTEQLLSEILIELKKK